MRSLYLLLSLSILSARLISSKILIIYPAQYYSDAHATSACNRSPRKIGGKHDVAAIGIRYCIPDRGEDLIIYKRRHVRAGHSMMGLIYIPICIHLESEYIQMALLFENFIFRNGAQRCVYCLILMHVYMSITFVRRESAYLHVDALFMEMTDNIIRCIYG